MELNLDPGFDADLLLALGALARGWLTREAIERAILEYDRMPGARLLSHLPLSREQRLDLQSPGSNGIAPLRIPPA